MEKNNELTLSVKFKVKDVLRYNISVARKNIVNVAVLSIGAAVFIYFIYKMLTSAMGPVVYLSRNVMLLLVPILIFAMVPWRVWQITLSQMQLPAFAYGVTYKFTPEFILLDIGEASDEMPWDLFVKVVETKHDFRFYINTISAQIIPKHNIKPEEMEALRAMIKQAVKPEACQLK